MTTMMNITGVTLSSNSLPTTLSTRVSGRVRQCGGFTEPVIFGPPQKPEDTEVEIKSNLSTSKASLPKIEDMDESFKSPYCWILANNLDSCLLDGNVWGKETHRFDPGRGCKSTQGKLRSFVSFGPFLRNCPAKEESGARIVSLQGEDDSSKMTWRLECLDPKVMAAVEAKGGLSLERNAYDDLMLGRTR